MSSPNGEGVYDLADLEALDSQAAALKSPPPMESLVPAASAKARMARSGTVNELRGNISRRLTDLRGMQDMEVGRRSGRGSRSPVRASSGAARRSKSPGAARRSKSPGPAVKLKDVQKFEQKHHKSDLQRSNHMLEIMGSHDHTTHALSVHAAAGSPDHERGRSRSPGSGGAGTRDASPRPSSRHAPHLHEEMYSQPGHESDPDSDAEAAPMTEDDKQFWKTAMRHADKQVEEENASFHPSHRSSFTATATKEDMRHEIKWLNALFGQIRTSLRARYGINYDGSRTELALENAGTGRWGNQREEDKKFNATKDEILEYLAQEKGVPPEAGDWNRLVHIWRDAKEALASRKILTKRVDEATSKLNTAVREKDDAIDDLRTVSAKFKSLQREHKEVCQQRDQLQAALTQVETHHANSADQTDAQIRENRVLSRRAEDAESRAAELVKKLQADQDQMTRIRAEADLLRSDLDAKASKLQALEQQSEARRRQHLEASGEARRNADELEAWEERKREWANEKAELTANAQNFKALAERNHDELLAFQRQSDAELVNLQRKITGERRSAESIANTHAGKIKQLEGDLSHLKSRAEAAESRLQDALTLNQATTEDRQAAEDTAGKHALRIQQLEKEVDQVVARAEASESQLRDAWDQLGDRGGAPAQPRLSTPKTVSAAVASLQLQIRQLTTDNKAVKIQLDSTRDELEANRLSLRASQETATQEIAMLRETSTRHEQEFQTRLQRQLDKERETEAKTKEVIGMLRAEIDTISNQDQHEMTDIQRHFQGVVRERDQEIAGLRTAARQATAEHEDAMFHETERHAREIQDMEQEKHALQREALAARQKCDEYQAEINRLHKEVKGAHETAGLRLSSSRKPRGSYADEHLGDVMSTHTQLVEDFGRSKTKLEELRTEIAAERHMREEMEKSSLAESARLTGQYGKQVQQMTVRLADLKEEASRLERENNGLRDDKVKLEQRVDELRSDMRNQADEGMRTTTDIARAASVEQAKLRDQLAASQKRVSSLTSEISALNADALRLVGGPVNLQASTPEAQLDSIRRRLQNAAEDIAERDRGQAALLSKAERLESEVAGLNQRVLSTAGNAEERLLMSSRAAEGEQNKINDVLDGVRKGFLTEKEHFKQQVEAARAQTLEVNALLHEERQKNEKLKSDFDDLERRHNLSEQTNGAMTMQVETEKAQLEAERHRAQDLHDELSRVAGDLAVARAALTTAEAKAAEQKTRETSLKNEVEMLERNAAKANEAIAAAKSVQEHLDLAKNAAALRQAELESENDDLTREVSVLSDTLRQTVNEKEALDANLKALEAEHGAVHEQHRGLREVHDNYKSGTQTQLDTLRARIDASQVEIEAANTSLAAAEREMEDLNAELQDTQERVAVLTDALKEAEAAKNQLATSGKGMEANIEQKEAQIDNLQKELATAQAQSARKLKSLNRRLADAESLAEIERQKAAKAAQTMRQLEDKNRRLRNQLAEAQADVEAAESATSQAKRNNVRLRATVQDLESRTAVANKGLQSALLSTTTQPPLSSTNAPAVDATRMAADLTLELDKHAQVHTDIEQIREASEAASRQDYDRRINNLQGQMKSLNATAALDRSFQATHRPTTSTPRKGD